MLLYFLPGREEIDRAGLAALGLDYVSDGEPARCAVRTAGPDGQPGLIVAATPEVAGRTIGYYPAEQQWERIPHCQVASLKQPWVGRFADAPIAPAGLARRRQLAGHWIELADGQQWLVPVARGWTEEDGEARWYRALPRRMVCDAEGHWSPGEVLPAYARLWQIAERWQAAIDDALAAWARQAEAADPEADVSIPIDVDDLHGSAVEVLAANYRLGVGETMLLGLLASGTAQDILDALVDGPTRRAWLEKKTAADRAGASSSVGPAA